MAYTTNTNRGEDDCSSSFALFPQLPQEPYIPPTQFQQRDAHISEADIVNCKVERLDSLLQIAWTIVISNFTNVDDVLFGLAYHGRRTDTNQQAIMPFRLQFQREATLAQLLAAAKTRCQELARFEHMGHEKFSVLNPDTVAIGKFRNLLVLKDRDSADQTNLTSFPPTYSQRYPLSISCVFDSHSLDIHACADPAVISSDFLQIMLLQFTDVLRTAFQNPQSHIRDLLSLGTEGREMLIEWDKSFRHSDETEIPIHEAIEARILVTPSAPAVCAWDGDLTFQELNQWASHIANLLVNVGVRPGKFVGIHMFKSRMAVVAILGIIKAGGAFVFLPPSIPKARLIKMCQITGMHSILSIGDLAVAARDFGPLLLDISTNKDGTFHYNGSIFTMYDIPSTLSVESNSNDPLYAVFTSGSLGEPKCVVVSRKSFGPGARNVCDRTHLGPGSRVLQFCSYAFVVTVFEHLITLSAGACLCIPSEIQVQSDLEGAISCMNVNWAVLTPSVARSLSPWNIPNLKRLLLAGEEVTREDRDHWEKYVVLYSLYGQAEGASTYFLAELSGSSLCQVGDLGKMSWGTFWIVDPEDHERLRPIGTEGELMFESSTLSQGYLNDSKKTLLAFVKRPRWLCQMGLDSNPSRYLLTGDLVRVRDLHGSVQFLGRKGTRTKIRGQRVELGEVECLLRRYYEGAKSTIADVISITMRNNEKQSPNLVAFVFNKLSQENPGPGTVTEGMFTPPSLEHRLRARKATQELRRILPSYMIPSAILPLEYLPKTLTGKINRRILRQAASSLTWGDLMPYRFEKPTYIEPRTTDERILQSICVELFAIPHSEVSIEDNFFNLGGDSLIARQLVSKARLQGFQFTLAQVFEEPTLASLVQCGRVQDAQVVKVSSLSKTDPFRPLFNDFLAELPPDQVIGDIEDIFPALEMQAMCVDQNVIDYFPFEINGPLDKHQLRIACETVVRNNASLRSRFLQFRGQVVQVVLRHTSISVEEEPGLQATPKRDPTLFVRSYCLADKARLMPMDQPVVGFMLFPISNLKHIFVVRLTHAQYDGVCLRSLGAQISAAYGNQPFHISIDFPQYRRECEQLRTPEALGFWRTLLAGAEVSRLPCCPGQEGDGCDIYAGECRSPPPPIGITMATAIKAAWSYILYRETGQKDVVFGQIVDGRAVSIQGAEDTIGMCLNTIPVRVNYKEKSGTVTDLFRQIQHQHVQAIEFETVGWKDIAAQCDSWPKDTDLDSVVLHENFGGLPSLTLGQATGKSLDPIFTVPGRERHCLVTWPESENLKTYLVARAGKLDKAYAERLLEDFHQTLLRFLDSPESQL
ncbi:hypothetical protein LOZ57_001569 [Ophidiomyces ophidiicola]|uniref:uncharacterized protein n=1 Tax=Ophidiomyces ophidiicola TaxID=1387563 RepID=UPI0020C3F2AD|nr:uncharacterized protein LOZ57_001569 [Ophidiomyces ophidiicola]KAI1951020.1 hypothetical protein LOZ57_001569 [Ophidiomyces ophidiicola]KAI2060961.1 hypothetical protein LOZ43_001417 [Ophidiomyces ophidiicola]